MESFYYEQPVPIDFGIGKLEKIVEIIASFDGQKGLLMTTPSMIRQGVIDKIQTLTDGKIIAVFSGIQPNPTLKNTDECVHLLQEHACDFAIALGGGSVIDCAKMATCVAKTSYDTAAFFYKEQQFKEKGIPLIVLPTTAGTASEITNVSVLTDEDKKVKLPVFSPYLYASYALIDPKLTVSCPVAVTASSGLDVLAHALEAFYNIRHQPYTDLMAEKAASLVFDHLLTAYREPTNLVARAKMSEASVTAGFAFNMTQTAAAHACSYPLTQIYGVPHGEACALTLAAFWRLNSIQDKRLDAFSKRLGFENALALADEIDFLKQQLNMRETIEQVGVKTEEQLDELVSASFAPNMANNPVRVTKVSLKKLYEGLSVAKPVRA